MEINSAVLQQIAANTQDLVLVFHLSDRKFSFVSDTAKFFFGEDAEPLFQDLEKLLEYIFPDDRNFLLRELQSLEREVTSINTEFRLLLKDKEVKWVLLKAFALEPPGQQREIGGFLEDISKRKEYELNLYNIKEQKDTILHILAHDLRRPINNIKMSSSLIASEVKEEKVQRLLNIINNTCKSSLELISEILEVEYMETRGTATKKTRINLVDRIYNQIDTYRLQGTRKTLIVNSNKPAVYVKVDVVKFMLVIENIISNAYKFTGPDGRIEIEVEEKEERVLLKVSDNGIGIPENLKPYIFDKFTKARREGMQGEKPVGLGMHLIRSLVELHNGRIWIESEENKGTTVFVEVPK